MLWFFGIPSASFQKHIISFNDSAGWESMRKPWTRDCLGRLESSIVEDPFHTRDLHDGSLPLNRTRTVPMLQGREKHTSRFSLPIQGQLRLTCAGQQVLLPFQCVYQQEQLQWSLPEFLETLYPSTLVTKRKQKFFRALDGVQETHRRMWPGVEIPQILSRSDGSDQLFISTSMVMATLVWGWCSPLSSGESRLLCGNLLQALISMTTSQGEGLFVRFPALEADGSVVQREQVVGNDGVIACWTDSMSEEVSAVWDSSVLNDEQPFPKSSRTRTQLHDFVLWSLEPTPIHSTDHKLKHVRRLLSASAYALLTNVASDLEARVLPTLL